MHTSPLHAECARRHLPGAIYPAPSTRRHLPGAIHPAELAFYASPPHCPLPCRCTPAWKSPGPPGPSPRARFPAYGPAVCCVPGMPGCLSVRSASVPKFKAGRGESGAASPAFAGSLSPHSIAAVPHSIAAAPHYAISFMDADGYEVLPARPRSRSEGQAGSALSRKRFWGGFWNPTTGSSVQASHTRPDQRVELLFHSMEPGFHTMEESFQGQSNLATQHRSCVWLGLNAPLSLVEDMLPIVQEHLAEFGSTEGSVWPRSAPAATAKGSEMSCSACPARPAAQRSRRCVGHARCGVDEKGFMRHSPLPLSCQPRGVSHAKNENCLHHWSRLPNAAGD